LHQVERSYIKLLNKNDVIQKEIARRTKHTRKTVRRMLKEPTDKEYRREDMGSIVGHFQVDFTDIINLTHNSCASCCYWSCRVDI